MVDTPDVPPTSVGAGSYSGGLIGVSQGIALNSVFSLTLAQERGTLSGTYALTGTLSDGFSTVAIQGTGTITGTIAQDNNPSVNVTVRTAARMP